MIYKGKYKVLSSSIAACDYEYILKQITIRIKNGRGCLISPIASHTLVLANYDIQLNNVLNRFDFLVPDSHWIKESLNFLYKIKLNKRVYGPTLMLQVCQLAEEKQYKVMLYGNTKSTLSSLKKELKHRYPNLNVIKEVPSLFSKDSKKELENITSSLISQRPNIIFVSLGSPLQEKFSVELYSQYKKINKFSFTVIPVGAAFDFLSKKKNQAPGWMQEKGLEWLFRLLHEPIRLSIRYLVYGPFFVVLIFYQKLQMHYSTFVTTNPSKK